MQGYPTQYVSVTTLNLKTTPYTIPHLKIHTQPNITPVKTNKSNVTPKTHRSNPHQKKMPSHSKKPHYETKPRFLIWSFSKQNHAKPWKNAQKHGFYAIYCGFYTPKPLFSPTSPQQTWNTMKGSLLNHQKTKTYHPTKTKTLLLHSQTQQPPPENNLNKIVSRETFNKTQQPWLFHVKHKTT